MAETLEGAERLVDQFSTQRESTLDACASTLAEGEALQDEVKTAAGGAAVLTAETDTTGSLAAVQTTLEKLAAEREVLQQLWATRKLRLDLCLQLVGGLGL